MYKKDLIIDQRTDHCEEICVEALISKNNSTCKNAVSQELYGS